MNRPGVVKQESAGTLYPILHSLERAGYLRRTHRLVRGKVRKYYSITGEGRRLLAEARVNIRELVGEVLEARGPGGLTRPGERGRAR